MKKLVINKRKGIVNNVMKTVQELSVEEQQKLIELTNWEFMKPIKYRFTPAQLLTKILNDNRSENDKTIASFG